MKNSFVKTFIQTFSNGISQDRLGTNKRKNNSTNVCCIQTTDPNFIYMQHGQLHLGNFSASSSIASAAAVTRAGAAAAVDLQPKSPPKLSW